MKSKIPFQKDILFKTKISEITSVALEDTLKIEATNQITGEFIISGDYKITSASINREKFLYKIPFTHNLDVNYNVDQTLIEIANFDYEIINHEILRIKLEVELEGALIETLVPEREEPVCEPEVVAVETSSPQPVINEEKIKSLFDTFDDKDETFSTYHVYIVQPQDTLETIMERYQITKDELALYNNLDSLKLGDKIIVPAPTNE